MPRSSADSSDATPWRRVGSDGSITLAIHAQPGAARTEVAGIHGERLKIRLGSPAIDGRANAELIEFLAASFDVPRRNVALIRGETGRAKTLVIAAPRARPDRGWERL